MRTCAMCLFAAVVLSATIVVAGQEQEQLESAAPPAVEYRVEDGRLLATVGDESRAVDLPAPAVAALRSGQRIYVALGEHGAAVLETGEDPARPALVKRFPVAHGRVVGFVEIDNEVWMRIESTAAVLLEGGVGEGDAAVVIPGPGPQAARPAADAVAAAPKRRDPGRPVRILEIHRERGEVVLDVGADHGVEIGDRFVAYRELEGREGKIVFSGQAEVADLEVVAAGPETALAILGRGDRTRLADDVRPAEPDRLPGRAYPRHMDRVGELALTVRPLFNVSSEKGFGMLSDVIGTWWGRGYFLNLRMQPLGFGRTDDGSILSTSLLAEAGFDGRAFAIGLGAGAAVVNGDLGKNLVRQSIYEVAAAAGDDRREVDWADRTRAAFALSQVLRLGARGGFNITLHNLLLYYDPPEGGRFEYDDEKAGFYYGGTSGRITIPLALRVDMFLGGGGGLVGYFFSEVGVFVWARGNGDAGSIGFNASGGFAGIWGNIERSDESYSTQKISILGPMISLGLTCRFGPDDD